MQLPSALHPPCTLQLHLEGPDVVAPSVLRVIGQLTALTHLSLHSQYTMHSLPQQMCHLSNLQHLHIEGWSCLETLPEELGQLQSLKQVILLAHLPCENSLLQNELQ